MTDTTDTLEVQFLADGGQQPGAIAGELASFIGAAQASLDIAIYDCSLQGDLAATVGGAIQEAAHRGVQVRLGYYAGPHQNPTVPPPHGSSPDFADSLGVPVKGITGYSALMHHKYVVRDAGSPAAAVWTGSTNWTSDAWAREENVIVRLESSEMAGYYRADFDDMWQRGKLDNSGGGDGGTAGLTYSGQSAAAQVWFSPDCGPAMAHAVAQAISAATQRIVIATPVLTVGSVLGALRDVVQAGQVPVSGVYDATQMAQVNQQWSSQEGAEWKIEAFAQIAQAGHLAGKHSTPYAPGSVHDYMHMKAIVVDNTVFTGSYNFSHSGEENAENLLRLDSGPLAGTFIQYIQTLISRYGGS